MTSPEAPPRVIQTEAQREAVRLKAERELCEKSFPDFLSRLTLRSDDPHHPAPKRLIPHPYQSELAERWQAHESQVILKRRQVGASVALRGYALWRAQYHGWNIGYYSRGIEEADEWLEGVVNMSNDLAPHLKVKPRRRGRVAKFGSGSIRVFPGTQRAGISFTFQLIIADEAAHHKYGAANYENYAPALGAGSQYICLSTADPALGPTGWFYDMWTQANNGTLPYKPVFIDRWARPDQGPAWFEQEEKRYAGNSAALLANYPVEPEQAFQGREGLVYGWDSITSAPIFDRARHVRDVLPLAWKDCRWRIVAIDPGGRDPTAILPVGVGSLPPAGDVFVVPGLLYEREALSAMEMSEYLGRVHAEGKIDVVFVDPSQPTLISTLRRLGWNAHPAKNAKLEGIGAVRTQLMAGRLFFQKRGTEPLVHEFETYWWPRQEELRAGGSPSDTRTGKGHHADALDALRYAILGVIRGLPSGIGVINETYNHVDRGSREPEQSILDTIRAERKRREYNPGARRAQPARRP